MYCLLLLYMSMKYNWYLKKKERIKFEINKNYIKLFGKFHSNLIIYRML